VVYLRAEVCRERNNIVVTGIPPANGFNEWAVLKIVQYQHDPGAELITFRAHTP
jgi:hypothetical protein